MACELLEGIIEKVGAGCLRWKGTHKSLDPLRSYPRFVAVLARDAARFPAEGQAHISSV